MHTRNSPPLPIAPRGAGGASTAALMEVEKRVVVVRVVDAKVVADWVEVTRAAAAKGGE